MIRALAIAAIFAACAACRPEAPQQSQEAAAVNDGQVSNDVAARPETVAPGQAGGLPDDRNTLDEGPIDPKSAQGAGQVLQSYAALLEQSRFAEARRLWSNGGEASGLSEKEFAETNAKFAEIHGEVGAPGGMEGAAGSSYVMIPFRLYGKLRDKRPYNSVGTVTLRRVNDVPGSTEEQRRWRIYRMDMQPQ
jgi:hypothetical protein